MRQWNRHFVCSWRQCTCFQPRGQSLLRFPIPFSAHVGQPTFPLTAGAPQAVRLSHLLVGASGLQPVFPQDDTCLHNISAVSVFDSATIVGALD